MNYLRITPLLLVVAVLSACAPMTPQECKTANWFDVGLRDGREGEPMSMLDDRTKACAEAGVQANTQQYLAGRNQGLPDYCRLDNAARVGLAGKTYHGVCASGIDGEFRRRHSAGYEVYQSRNELNNLESRRRTLEKRLSDAKTDAERRRARDELNDLDYRLRRARDRLRDAEWALDRMR